MRPITFIDRRTGEQITESPPGEGFLKFLYYHPFGKLALHALVKRKLLSALYGRLMSRAASARDIAPFVARYGIDMSEAEREVSAYRSFNDFFYRKLKPAARPLGEGFVSPADGKLVAFEHVDAWRSFFVKGEPFTLARYLRDEHLASQFEQASLLVLRLAPNDYHRFHFPCEGRAAAPVRIRGAYFSVSPYAVRENFARVFCENKRSYTLLDTPDFGQVLISPVGATMVGSIVETYPFGSTVAKGDEMGYFAFGGSSLLLLIDRRRIQLAADLLENTRQGLETAVRMGETIGQPQR